MSGTVVTQQFVRELAAQVIRRALHGPHNGETPVIDTCRSHPDFAELAMEDRDNLIDAVFDATETAHITISWDDTIVSVIGKPDGNTP